jgi:hypothetical protein
LLFHDQLHIYANHVFFSCESLSSISFESGSSVERIESDSLEDRPRLQQITFLSRRDRREAPIAAASIYQINPLFSDLGRISCHLPANPGWHSGPPKISAN